MMICFLYNFFSKQEVKALIEAMFSVKVLKVNSIIFPLRKNSLGRFVGFKSSHKRMIVTLLRI
jgi:ribosomal protein L23